jgi:hypothetical protein
LISVAERFADPGSGLLSRLTGLTAFQLDHLAARALPEKFGPAAPRSIVLGYRKLTALSVLSEQVIYSSMSA